MSMETAPSHGVMEGKGAYNKSARLQANGAVYALPFLEKAIQNAILDSSGPVVVADYGSSEGKNSLIPMRLAVQCLRKRVGPQRPISVFHIDQHSNDFNTLFQVLQDDPDRYTADDPNVHPAAIGRSFYESVLAPSSVHLGWSSYAAMWLSEVPTLLRGHFIPICCSGAARELCDRQAAKDWEAFLSLRAQELCPGGRLVVVLPGIGEDGRVGLEPLFDHANAVLEEMVAAGKIAADERERMVIMTHPRPESDLLRPFERDGEFRGLVVEDSKISVLADTAWEEYQRSEDEHALASSRALFFRSAFLPSLACALNPASAKHGDPVRSFGDQLETRLTQRLVSQRTPMESFVQIIVFAKKT